MRFFLSLSPTFLHVFWVDSSTKECRFGILALSNLIWNLWMIHFISECICSVAQFHGTGTVKRVDLVFSMVGRKSITQRFATERNDFTQQNHPHQQQYNSITTQKFVRGDRWTMYTQSSQCKSHFCHLIFKRIYFAQVRGNRISEKKRLNKDFLLQSVPELTAEHVLY